MASIQVSLQNFDGSTIRVIVVDQDDGRDDLAVENWPRAAALAFHGLPETKKPRQRVLTGPKTARRSRL